MRAGDRWGAAARRPDGEIVTTGDAVPTWARRTDDVPIVRGAVAMVETIMVGLRALKWSAQVADPEEDAEITNRSLALTTAAALLIFAAIFAVVPAAVSRALGFEGFAFAAVEAVVRLALFGGYLLLIGRSPGIPRTFAYHGAEHMVIAAHEHGAALTVEGVRPFSVRHARCGTDFLLLVVVVAIVVFSFVGRRLMAGPDRHPAARPAPGRRPGLRGAEAGQAPAGQQGRRRPHRPGAGPTGHDHPAPGRRADRGRHRRSGGGADRIGPLAAEIAHT